MVDFNNIDFETAAKPEEIEGFDFEGTGDIPGFIQEVEPSLWERGKSAIGDLFRKENIITPGNIDLNNRPVVQNADGSESTERSISIGTDEGEVLIPTVINGKVVSSKDAVKHYQKTGEHLGIFKDVESATEHADKIHGRFDKDTQSPIYEEMGLPVGKPEMGMKALGVPFMPMQTILEAPGAVTEAGLAARPEALEEKGPSILDITEKAGQKLAVAFPGGFTAEDAGGALDLDPELAGMVSRVATDLGANWLYAGGVLKLLGSAGKGVVNSNLWRRMHIKERQLVAQSLDNMVTGMKAQGASEAQILRKVRENFGSEAAFERFAKQQGIKPEPITPRQKIKEDLDAVRATAAEKLDSVGRVEKPIVKPKTKLGKEVLKDISKERKPSSLATLTKREAEIIKDDIDFEPKPIPEPAKPKKVAPAKAPEAVEPKIPSNDPEGEWAAINRYLVEHDASKGKVPARKPYLPIRDEKFAEEYSKTDIPKSNISDGLEDARHAIFAGEKLGYRPDDIARYLERNYVNKEHLKAIDKVERQASSRFEQEGIWDPKQKGLFDNTFYSGVPVHELSKASKGLARTYQKHIGDPLWKALSETLPEGAGKRSQIVDAINKGIILDYRKDPDFIELRDDSLFKIEQAKEKSKELAGVLNKFKKAEQIRISQIIRGSVTATPERYKHALDVARQFKVLEKELQRLGILGPDNRFRQLTRKELASKFKEIGKIDKQIETLKKRLKPVVKYSRMVRMVSEDVSEEVLSTVSETTTGKFKTESTKWTGLVEKRIKEALISRGFAEGEASQMISRVKESVVPIDSEEGTLKEIKTKVEKVVTKTITQEIEKLKTYSPSMMARARGSLVKDIKKQSDKRNAILDRIRLHYKMSGKQYLRRAYESIENERGFLKKLTSYVAKRPRLKKGYDIRRKDLSHHYRQYLGEIKQAPYLVYKGLSEEYHDMFMMQMFERISKNKKWAVSPKEWDSTMKIKARGKQQELYKDFKPLPMSDKLGPLSGAMVDPYIWDDLNQAVKQVHPMVEAHDKLLRLWKMGKVPYNPATQVRNILSNTILADFAGLPPHRIDVYAETARDLLTKSGYWLEAKQTPLLGKEWIGGEISEFLTDVSELKDGNFAVQSANSIKHLLNKPLKVYQGIEQFYKLALFINQRKAGVSIKNAYKHAEKWIFNYQKIPPAIRWAKRYYSPFITFSYKAMPRMAETAVRKPWKFVKYGMLMLAVEEITRRMYGESKEEVEREKKVLPDYMRKTVLPGQLSHLRISYKDKYNRSKYLDLSFILPWGDIAEQWGQSHFVGRPFLPSHPLYITVGEIAFNEVLFTGQELTVKDLDEGSEYLKKLGTQIWRQAAPSLAGSYSYNKLMAALYGERDWALRERSVGEAVFDVFFGLKIRSIDYNQEHARRIKNLKSKINEIRERFSHDYEKIFIRNPTPDYENDQRRYLKIVEKKDKAIDKIMDKIMEIEK